MILKAYQNSINIKLKSTAILLFIIVLIQACSSTKYIADYQSIVKKVTIDSVDAKFEEQAYNYVQKDIRPASKLSINVPLYNLFNTKDGRYKTSDIKPFGTPPAILDSTLVEISRTQIQKFLKSKGYRQAEVTSAIKIADKKAEIVFSAKPGPAYFIEKISDSIPNANIRNLYESNKAKISHLHKGMQYDEDSLTYEREQIYRIMKENGYFYFLRPYVNFDVYGAEPSSKTNKIDLNLNVTDPANGPHKQFNIGYTHLLIAPNPDGLPDSARYKLSKDTLNGIIYTDFSKRYRRNPIVRYDFLKQGDLYDIRNENLTYDRLYELNVFKNVKIDYFRRDSTSNKINAIILLTPQKVMSNRVEGEVPFNGGTVGFTIGNTYTNNNIFRGAERFELQVKGGLQSRIGNGAKVFSDIYQRDFSISASISVPRLMIPFYNPVLGGNGMPHTTFATSYIYALQKDVSVRRIFINSITYDWFETKSKLHSFTPLNFEYRFGNLDTSKVDAITRFNNLYYSSLLDRKDLTLGMKYTYTLNADKLNQLRTFVYLRAGMDIAGNMLQGISKLTGSKHDPANNDPAKILGLPFNQYTRPEVDIRWYKHLGGERQFVARLNTGLAYAYGNSILTGIPFEKQFFAGGSNGLRAWQARTIGPGNYNRQVLASDEVRKAVFGLDQLGTLRIETNFEYRFTLARKFFGATLKGAAFVDAGNIWNIRRGESITLEYPELDELTVFKLSKLAKQIAIGTGVGLRYDVQYFVFRFDVGLKLKDPQFIGSDQWVISKFLSGARDFKNSYNATHGPDTYRFLQYNFGIGMPF
ncbi:Outer membrane protein assembly factor BamA [Pedobacter sp. Bi27]|uniref:translocation and assembly module lipoprotein TamL n=1 Tax=unclassified Pedobacter TaxID=2628915 RepID=UPI001D4B8EA1|nr:MULTISPECIES: BamA/TamA family outer membrane protein [unclassified Pedobacter]CAH0259057.1 Outer membrane protein assembly factor BamA [Pedobacter sp. Bi36]CAH0286055.1 Outer membrane protein assembly factor BamA [Pedobacter sp. Bi126]CAH0289562.1 Outer membrane protein assembly factor BamA [Pedobacter sp. Bi27]